MVDKNKINTQDDQDDWSAWDDDDYNYEFEEEPKDDRSPVTRTALGAIKGFGKDLISPDRLKEITKNVLPKGFGDAIDIVDNFTSTSRGLYNEAVKDIAPTLNEGKRAVNKLSAKYRDRLPDYAREVTDRWDKQIKEEDEAAERERDWQQRMGNRDEDELQRQLNETLGVMADQNADQQADTQARDAIRDDIEDKRFNASYRQFIAMQKGISSIAGFNQDYAARYMRKSLELKYRSVAVQKAHFQAFQKAVEIAVPLLQGIQKNTGLPDFIKNTNSELLKKELAQRLFGKSAGLLSGDFESSFFGKAVDNVRNGVVRNIQDTVGMLRDGINMGGMVGDQMGGASDYMDEGDAAELQGDMAGATISSIVVPWLASKVGMRMQRIAQENPESRVGKAVAAINAKGDNASYYVRNIGKLMQQDISDNLYDPEAGILAGAARRLGASIFTLDRGRNTTVQNLNAADLSEHAQFDRLTHRSINEVMPGLMTRMLRELTAIRTGDTDADSETYDNMTGRFVSSKSRIDSAKDVLFNRRQMHEYTKGFNNVFDSVDKEGQLSQAAKDAMRKQMVRDNDANLAFDPLRYREKRNFSGEIDPAVSAELHKFFTERYNVSEETDDEGKIKQVIGNRDQYYKERNRADLAYGKQKSYRPDLQNNLNLLKGTGDADLLVKMGVLKRSTDGSYSVNHEAIESEFDKYIDDEAYVRRKFADTDIERQANKDTTAPAPIINVKQRNDRRNTKALNRLSGKLDELNNRPTPEPAPGPPTREPEPPRPFENGFGKWWNDQGVITSALEEQYSSWQQIQLEAAQEAAGQRQTMLELLHEIGVVLADTAQRQANSNASEGDEPFDGSFGGRLKRLAMNQLGGLREGAGLLNRVGAAGGRAAGGALRTMLPAAFRTGSFMGKQLWKSMKGTVNTQIAAGKASLGAVMKLTDVYVAGETKPRLLAAKLKQGLYIDVLTGKTIFNVKDITGPVEDADGNQVITAEDFQNGLVNRWGRALDASGIMNAWSKGKARLQGMYSNILSVPDRLKKMVTSAYQYADRPVDIYVAGEPFPRLLAMVMLNGGYFRKSDGKVIKHYDDIDGDVLDAQGDTVLSLADMRKGLVNKEGEPLRRMKEKLFELGKKVLTLPMTLLRKGKELAAKVGKGVANQLSRFGNWWNEPTTMLVGTTSLLVDKMDAIYNLLDERMPGGKQDYRDSTGDGVRDGSLADLRAKREEKDGKEEKKDEKKEKDKDGKKGILGKLGEMFSGSKFGQMLANGPLGKMLGVMGGMFTGGIPGALWGGVKLAGMGLGAIGSGIGAAATGLWGMLGGSAGLSALLFNPVTLGILGAGAAIWAGWKIYKHFADKPDPMQKLRLFAYGAKGDDSDFNEKLLKMEFYMVEHVQSSGDGMISFDSKVSAEEVLKIWEIGPQDQDRLSQWMRWYKDRFIPVFARAWKLFGTLLPDSKKFMEMDNDPDGRAKVKWSEQFIWPATDSGSPYFCEASPVGNADATLYMTGAGTSALLETQLEEIRKKYANQKLELTRDEAMLRWDRMDDVQRKQQSPSALAGQKATDSFSDNQYQLASGTKKDQFNTTVVVEGITRRGKQRMTGGRIDELTAVRMRAYGLDTILLSQVNALLDLEALMNDYCTVSEGRARFTGNLFEIYQQVAAKFQRSPESQADFKIWNNWANNRFFPIYLQMILTCNKEGGEGKLVDLLPNLNDLIRYELATDIVNAQYSEDGEKKPVWDWPSCGFAGVNANTDSSTTALGMGALKSLADKYQVHEKNAKEAGEGNEAMAKLQDQTMAAAGYVKKDGRWVKKWKSEGNTEGQNFDPSFGRKNAPGTEHYANTGGGGRDDPTGLGGTGVSDYSGLDSTGLMKPAKGPGAERGRKLLLKSAVKQGINNPMEVAMLLANAEHESRNYDLVREGRYTTAKRLCEVFPKYFRTLAEAQAALNAGPAAVFERVYGGRMGNDKKGDGGKYPGRGYMQVTGKDNYKRVGDVIGKDLVNNPEYAETPEGAADVSVGWWKMQGNRISQPAQAGQVDTVRKVVNGGTIGIQDVRRRSGYWMQQAKNGELAKMIKDAGAAGPDADAPESRADVQEDTQAAAPVNPATQETSATPEASPSEGAPPAASYPGNAGAAASAQAAATPEPAPASEPVATPPPEARPTNPGANRGYGPAGTPEEVQQSADQTAKASDGFYSSAGEILTQQLAVQKEIAESTKQMAISMADLATAVKNLKLGNVEQSSSPAAPAAPSAAPLPSRPQGASPTRNRYS